MSLSKQDVLDALKEKGIHNLEDLANAAVESKASSKTQALAVFVHPKYVIDG